MEIKSTNVFNAELNNSALRGSLARSKWLLLLLSLTFIFLGILLIAFASADEGSNGMASGIVLLISGVFFIPLVKLLSKSINKRVTRTNMLMSGNQTTTSYVFTEEYVTQIAERLDEYVSTTKFKYSLIYRAMETTEAFLIYPFANMSYVVPKDSIYQGTPQDLRNLLAAKLGTKFKPGK